MERMKIRKAGPITLALGLIIFGCILLISNIAGIGAMASVVKFWPLLLIGLGIEYFIRSYRNRKNGESEEETKFHLPTVIIIILAAFIVYTGQQVAALTKNNELSTLITEAIAGDSYSYKSEYESEAIDVKPGITSVKLDSLNARVDLVPSSDGKFHVQSAVTGWGPSEPEARRRAEMFKIDVKKGDVINVNGGQGQGIHSRRPLGVAYLLMIPKGINVYIENDMGQIKADNLEANLNIKAESAEVSVRGIKGNVFFEGENGQATFEAIDGNLETRLSSGKIFIKDVSKDIRAENDNSDIEISSSKPVYANYSINNYNGFIVLKIPEASDAVVTAKTETGKIRGSLNIKYEPNQPAPGQPVPGQPVPSEPGPGGKAAITLGAGKGSINLITVSGNIIIDKY